MAVNIYLKRSSTASKRPASTALAAGELALNYDANTSGLYFCNTAGGIVKVGPAEVSATAPNATPAGSTGNSKGEFWFNPSGCGTLQIWDGTAWRTIPPQATPISLGTVYGCTNPAGPYTAALGISATACQTTGCENTAVGFAALCGNTTGIENVAVGSGALRNAVGQSYNVAIGRWAGINLAAGESVVIGRNAMIGSGITGRGQVGVGAYALQNLTTGVSNTALGFAADCSITTGSYNTAIGYEVLFFNTTGSNNTAVGQGALSQGDPHNCNTAVGNAAGAFGPSTCGVYIGYRAGLRVTGIDNTAVGACSLATNAAMSGSNNTVLGARSGRALTTGANNVVVGVGTGAAMTTGASNVVIGLNAAAALTTGVCNIMIGQSAGSVMAAGNNNIVIGTQSHAISPAVNLDGMVIIGHNQNVGYVTGNQVSLSNGAGGRATFAGATPTAWTFASDGRLKDNVEDLTLGLDYVKKIRPVSYTWKECEANNESAWGVKAAGFIAQELLALEEESDAQFINSVNTDNPDCFMVGKESLIPVLVKAIQDLAAEVEDLKAQLSAQG